MPDDPGYTKTDPAMMANSDYTFYASADIDDLANALVYACDNDISLQVARDLITGVAS